MFPVYHRILQKLFVIGILSFSFLLPILPRGTGLYFGALLIVYLAEGNFITKLKTIFRNKSFWIFSSLFFLYLLGMIYTEDQRAGWANLQLKSGLLLAPLFFLKATKLRPPLLMNSLKAFVLGCLFTSMYTLSLAAVVLIGTQENHFTYYHLTRPLDLHPAYFSTYLIFCCLIIALPLLNIGNRLFRSPILNWALVFFFLGLIYLLSSRQQIIALFLLAIGLSAYYFFRQKKRGTGILVSILIAVFLALLVFIIPETRMRLSKMQEQLYQPYSNDAPNSVTVRKAVWQSAMELFAKQPLFGYGTGDVGQALRKKYAENNLKAPLEENLNAHNQFLQTALALGAAGLLLLVLHFAHAIQIAYRKADRLYLLFTLLILFSILTEAMLEAEMGIVFYTFFNGLLAARNTG